MKNINNLFNKRILCLTALSGILLISAGCGETKNEDIVMLDTDVSNVAYNLINVTRDNVVLTKQLVLTYVQEKDQEVSFNSGGRRIAEVYVDPGDYVHKGDPLVELDSEGLVEQIDELEYRISRNEKQLEYLDSALKFEEQSAYNNFVYNNSDIKEEDVEKYQADQDTIADNYRYRREDYNDELEFDRKKLSRLKNELASTKVISDMDGIVYKVADNLEGSTSRKDEVIITIVDNESGRFTMEEPDYAKYFHEGQVIDLKIVYGSALGDYEVVPYKIDEWDETQTFEIISAPETEGSIDVGTTSSIQIELDRRDGVLTLPLGAVHYADSRPYVYVIDDNDYRQIVWIETGLTGDDRIEITSGLSEGDQVVY